MNLVRLLEERAAEHPDAPALIDVHKSGDRVVSFGDLAERVAAGSAHLDAIGLKKGMTVLAFHPVSIELYEFLLAAFHRGLQVMLADPSGGREFLENCCARRAPDAFFGSWKANLLRLSNPSLRKIPIRITASGWFPGTHRWRTDHQPAKLLEVDDSHPALVTFTSGSTGLPKAAVRSHGFLLAQHRALADSLRFKAGEVDLITLPVFVLANLASGMTSVLADTDLAHPGKPDALAIMEQCRRHQVTRCAASPAFFEGLLRFSLGMPAFEQIFTGGAPVFPDLLKRLQEALPKARIESVYGSTEAEPIAHFAAEAWDEATRAITAKGGGLCSGKPVEQIELRVIEDQSGQPIGPLSAGEFDAMGTRQGQVGEIVVAGDHVLKGYLEGMGDEESKIQVEDEVWHRTGDAGWIDTQGRVWMLGRCSAKLPNHIAPAELPDHALAYPFAIECALREQFPKVRTAAIEWKSQRCLAIAID
ncbi:MAG: AMP-binding protein, partial [Akkermansiaceae bacterium]|nr:AMP-binding protein [Akkermansiaceae bacterium]